MSANSVRLHRVMVAPAERVYRAFLDSAALAKWLPPHGFTCTVHEMNNSGYRATFASFSSEMRHSFRTKFAELVPGERIRYTQTFENAELPGEMRVSITFRPAVGGTHLEILQEGIPEAIPADQCYLGWQESLNQLALLVEPEIG